MDGNGRWATARGLPRNAGHEAGVEAIRRVVEAAPEQGVGTLTLYAFSSDNWRRPKSEVSALMDLLRRYLAAETVEAGGKRHTPPRHRPARPAADGGSRTRSRQAERETASGDRLHLRVAIDYSARAAILESSAADRGLRRPDAGRLRRAW